MGDGGGLRGRHRAGVRALRAQPDVAGDRHRVRAHRVPDVGLAAVAGRHSRDARRHRAGVEHAAPGGLCDARRAGHDRDPGRQRHRGGLRGPDRELQQRARGVEPGAGGTTVDRAAPLDHGSADLRPRHRRARPLHRALHADRLASYLGRAVVHEGHRGLHRTGRTDVVDRHRADDQGADRSRRAGGAWRAHHRLPRLIRRQPGYAEPTSSGRVSSSSASRCEGGSRCRSGSGWGPERRRLGQA